MVRSSCVSSQTGTQPSRLASSPMCQFSFSLYTQVGQFLRSLHRHGPTPVLCLVPVRVNAYTTHPQEKNSPKGPGFWRHCLKAFLQGLANDTLREGVADLSGTRPHRGGQTYTCPGELKLAPSLSACAHSPFTVYERWCARKPLEEALDALGLGSHAVFQGLALETVCSCVSWPTAFPADATAAVSGTPRTLLADAPRTVFPVEVAPNIAVAGKHSVSFLSCGSVKSDGQFSSLIPQQLCEDADQMSGTKKAKVTPNVSAITVGASGSWGQAQELVTGARTGAATGEGTSWHNPGPLVVPTRTHLDEVRRLMRGDLYIGRGCKQRDLQRSPFANPYKVSVYGREAAVDLFADHLDRDTTLSDSLWKLSGRRLLCHCKDSQRCHGDFRRQFPCACDRSQFSAAPPTASVLDFLARLREEPESDDTSADEGAPPKGTGWRGKGPPMEIGTGHMSREIWASPGRWPPMARVYPESVAWSSIAETFWDYANRLGTPDLLVKLARQN